MVVTLSWRRPAGETSCPVRWSSRSFPVPRPITRLCAASGDTRGCALSRALAGKARAGARLRSSGKTWFQFRFSYSVPSINPSIFLHFPGTTLRNPCYRFATVASFYRQKSPRPLTRFGRANRQFPVSQPTVRRDFIEPGSTFRLINPQSGSTVWLFTTVLCPGRLNFLPNFSLRVD